MARKINAVSPNESRLNEFFADPERRNTSNFRGISYEDERRADANEIYESGTKWVNEQLESVGGSGGGAQPDWNAAEGEPGHILNRPFYETTETIFNQTVKLFEEEEGGISTALLPFGKFLEQTKYIVTYNGVKYECDAIDPGVGTPCALGNLAAFGGSDTGEPFLILTADVDEDGSPDLQVCDYGANTSATIKIEKIGEIRKIDNKFAPDIPYFDLVSLGLATLEDGKVYGKSGIGVELYEALGEGPVKIRVKHQDYYGNELDATAIVSGKHYLTEVTSGEYMFGWFHIGNNNANTVYIHITCTKSGYVEGRTFKHKFGTT